MTAPLIRRPVDLRAVSIVLLLCAILGIQQVIKSVASHVPPLMQLAIRFAGGTVFFASWVGAREGRRIFADGTLPSGLLLGSLFALEFVLAGLALARTTAAHTVVFLYTAPLFTALGLQMLPEERLDRIQWLGIGLAFGGMLVAFLAPRQSVASSIAGDLLALGGGAAWGLSNVALRHGRVGGAAASKTVLYQSAVAVPVLLAFAAVSGQWYLSVTPGAIWALVFQTLVISIVSYLVWFWLLRRYLTSRLMLLSLMTPLFGVVFGALLLREPIEPAFAAGAVLVLAGLFIVHRRPWRGKTGSS